MSDKVLSLNVIIADGASSISTDLSRLSIALNFFLVFCLDKGFAGGIRVWILL